MQGHAARHSQRRQVEGAMAEDPSLPRVGRRAANRKAGGSRMLRIMNKRSRCRQLREQAARADIEAVRALLESGVDPAARDPLSGNTAIMECLQGGAQAQAVISVINCLLDASAEVNDTNSEGMTPLMLAAYHGAGDQVATLLLDRGADPGVQDNKGVTALMYGAAGGHLHTLSKILEELDPSEINMQDNEGMICLHHAASTDHDAIVKLLVAHHADINAKDNSGLAVLDHAAAAAAADVHWGNTFLWVVQQPGQLVGLDPADLNRLLRFAVFGEL